ncbi:MULTISPECIES: ABC transporter ATP-binding protein [Corynebacterium]|uniref:ABC transporter ATP-binding protein n=1 Tax=Corynebacterium TaxID=1716 RepID=UPI001CE4167A|nr:MULTISPECIES: ABC transporter ATP-binding protein [Corynebacterium]
MKENSDTRSQQPVLELNHVVKAFGSHTAVNDLSLTVHAGEVVALLGPNGAGKTTTVEMCEGFQKPTSGSVTVFGLDPHAQTDEVRRRIGVMLQGGGAYPGIHVGEMLNLVASYSRNPLDTEWLLHTVGLERHVKTPYRRLSGGQQQRLSLACALVGRPELVFLDEPTAGLDAQSRIAVWELIRALRRDGVAVVLTTHLMDEAEALADHVAIIDRGSLVAFGTPAEMTAGTSQSQSLTVVVDQELDETALNAQVSPASIEEIKPLHYEFTTPGPVSPAHVTALAQAIESQGVLIRSLSVDRRSLEDVFLSMTGREIRQ